MLTFIPRYKVSTCRCWMWVLIQYLIYNTLLIFTVVSNISDVSSNRWHYIAILSVLNFGIYLYRILWYVLTYRLIWGIVLLSRDVSCSIVPHSNYDMWLASVITCVPRSKYDITLISIITFLLICPSWCIFKWYRIVVMLCVAQHSRICIVMFCKTSDRYRKM